MTALQTPRAAFHAVASDDTRAHGAILVYDDSEQAGTVTVTNDAARVLAGVAAVFAPLDSRPVLYRDTEGVWDGLAHDGQRFTGFWPLRAATEAEAVAALPTSTGPAGYDPCRASAAATEARDEPQ